MGNTAEKLAREIGPTAGQGKTAIITGGSAGLGLESARVLADFSAFDRVVLGCRDVEKGRGAVQGFANHQKITVMKLDLESFDSVKAFALEVLEKNQKIHVLMLNAGVYSGKGVTGDGFEKCFQVCHFAHFLLYRLLEQRLVESAPARVVVVASEAYRMAKAFQFPDGDKPAWDSEEAKKNVMSSFGEYGRAKLANIYFAKSVSERVLDKKVTCQAVHPGGVNTEIYPGWIPRILLRVLLTTVQGGAIPQVYTAIAPEVENAPFAFWVPGYVYRPQKESVSLKKDVQQKLWEESEKVIAKYL